MGNTVALSAALQDVSAKGPRRAFTLIGSDDCVVIFQKGLALGSTSFGTVMDPDDPTKPLTLKGPSASSREFLEPSSYLRYKVLSGTVTSCYLDAAEEPAAGPAGDPAPALKPTSAKTADYTAEAFDLVQCDMATASAGFTVTLPAAASVTAGTPIGIKNITTNTAHAITVGKTGSDTVDGGSSATMNTSKAYTLWISDGVSNWIGA